MMDTAAETSPAGSLTPKANRPISGMERAGLALGVLALLFLSFRVFAFVHDDAFITYRYSWHLRHGFGPVFNPGERAEGYSCPLYMVFTALLMFLPGDALVRAKLLGVAFAAAALWAVWRLARELELPDWACAAAPLLVGANPSVGFSAVDGMETSLQMLLVTLAAMFFVKERRTGLTWRSALPLIGVVLNRAEGFLYLLAAAAVLAVDAKRRGFGCREALWLAGAALPTGLFFLWRYAYYGWWMPNTYYAKNLALDIALEPGHGPAYVMRTLFYTLNSRIPQGIASVVLWLAALAGALSERVRERGALILPLFVGVQLAVALRSGGDWMQGWRYMMAIVPIWTLLVVGGLAEPGEALAKSGRISVGAALGKGAVVLVFGACIWAAVDYRNREDGVSSWADRGWATTSRGLLRDYRMENTVITADVLNERLPKGSYVAFSEVGAVPFFTPELRWLDTYGLTDSEIAHLPTMNRFRTGVTGDYTSPDTGVGKAVLRKRPDYIIKWIPAEVPELSILGGAYLPYFRAQVKALFGQPGTYVVQVWKRAD